jgi:3-deoxy-D-manno-octulosonic-acid transferase
LCLCVFVVKKIPMYLLYSAALLLAILIAAPYFLYQALAHKKYLGSLASRLGFGPLELPAREKRLLIHCVSVGEFLAAEPLIERLRTLLPDYRLVISTTTATGQSLARERASHFADICYFPIDFGFAVDRLLDRIEPSAVVILETELWPNFLRASAARAIPVIIANGRISDSSFRRYRLVRSLLRPVLANVTAFLMQSARDAERICSLGAPAERVSVSGNIKYDLGTAGQAARLDSVAAELESQLELSSRSPLLVAGSTVPGEETLLLSAFRRLINEPGLAGTRLLLAPRRPERFDQVADLLAASGLPFIRRSRSGSDNGSKKEEAKVILLDSLGELAAVYRYADLVFVGGSLVPYGGHNILEPALYGRAIITGPYTNNFHKIMQDFIGARAVIQMSAGYSEQGLGEEMLRLMKDGPLRSELGRRAREVMEANRGALEQQAEMIVSLVEREKTTKTQRDKDQKE